MKTTLLLPLAITAVAFVIPDEPTANQLRLQPEEDVDIFEHLSQSAEELWAAADQTFSRFVYKSQNVLDDAIARATETSRNAKQTLQSWTSFPARSWVDSAVQTDAFDFLEGDQTFLTSAMVIMVTTDITEMTTASRT